MEEKATEKREQDRPSTQESIPRQRRDETLLLPPLRPRRLHLSIQRRIDALLPQPRNLIRRQPGHITITALPLPTARPAPLARADTARRAQIIAQTARAPAAVHVVVAEAQIPEAEAADRVDAAAALRFVVRDVDAALVEGGAFDDLCHAEGDFGLGACCG